MQNLVKAALMATLLFCSVCGASPGIWGDYSNFSLNISNNQFTLQLGRSPVVEDKGVNIDYGVSLVGHYFDDVHAEDKNKAVDRWSTGFYFRYPLFHISGIDAPIQAKGYFDTGLLLDTHTMEDWYTPIGASAHISLERKVTSEGELIREILGIAGYQYLQDTGLYGESNVLTGGIVIRWKDK